MNMPYPVGDGLSRPLPNSGAGKLLPLPLLVTSFDDCGLRGRLHANLTGTARYGTAPHGAARMFDYRPGGLHAGNNGTAWVLGTGYNIPHGAETMLPEEYHRVALFPWVWYQYFFFFQYHRRGGDFVSIQERGVIL